MVFREDLKWIWMLQRSFLLKTKSKITFELPFIHRTKMKDIQLESCRSMGHFGFFDFLTLTSSRTLSSKIHWRLVSYWKHLSFLEIQYKDLANLTHVIQNCREFWANTAQICQSAKRSLSYLSLFLGFWQ